MQVDRTVIDYQDGSYLVPSIHENGTRQLIATFFEKMYVQDVSGLEINFEVSRLFR